MAFSKDQHRSLDGLRDLVSSPLWTSRYPTEPGSYLVRVNPGSFAEPSPPIVVQFSRDPDTGLVMGSELGPAIGFEFAGPLPKWIP